MDHLLERRPAGECLFNLNSIPPSEVFVDNACAGPTPSLGVRVRVGDHAVRFVDPNGQSKQTTVNCPQEGYTKTVRVRLYPPK